jgi:hypothetical protein
MMHFAVVTASTATKVSLLLLFVMLFIAVAAHNTVSVIQNRANSQQ